MRNLHSRSTTTGGISRRTPIIAVVILLQLFLFSYFFYPTQDRAAVQNDVVRFDNALFKKNQEPHQPNFDNVHLDAPPSIDTYTLDNERDEEENKAARVRLEEKVAEDKHTQQKAKDKLSITEPVTKDLRTNSKDDRVVAKNKTSEQAKQVSEENSITVLAEANEVDEPVKTKEQRQQTKSKSNNNSATKTADNAKSRSSTKSDNESQHDEPKKASTQLHQQATKTKQEPVKEAKEPKEVKEPKEANNMKDAINDVKNAKEVKDVKEAIVKEGKNVKEQAKKSDKSDTTNSGSGKVADSDAASHKQNNAKPAKVASSAPKEQAVPTVASKAKPDTQPAKQQKVESKKQSVTDEDDVTETPATAVTHKNTAAKKKSSADNDLVVDLSDNKGAPITVVKTTEAEESDDDDAADNYGVANLDNPVEPVKKSIGWILTNGQAIGQLSHLKDLFTKPEFSRWKTNYDVAKPTPKEITQLQSINQRLTVLVFIGSWCPMALTYTPPFIKALDVASNNNIQVQFYGLDREKTGHPLASKYGISRVPTIVVLQKQSGTEKEIARLTETPKGPGFVDDFLYKFTTV